MSTKSGHDLDPVHNDTHHHGDHHSKHHSDHSNKHHGHKEHHKHPQLRDPVMKAGRSANDGTAPHHGAAAGHGGGGHPPVHGKPRSNTLTRKDTAHGLAGKHHKGHHRDDHDRHSTGKHSDVHLSHMVEYENTYRMMPDSRFQEAKVREIIAKVLHDNLTEKDYDSRLMSRRCLELSEVIKERVKQLDMRRFKIICMVMIGQNADQSMMVSSRCLWNFTYDNFSSFTLKKGPYYAIGMVFASYTE